jgi:IMP dehydrogenase
MQNIPLALTFGDVLLTPLRSAVKSRSQVSLKTRITPKIEIDFPVISINMDCITGIEMSIAMAKFGGISFYPRFAPPQIQAKEVKQILDAGFNVIPAVGIKPGELERVDALVSVGAKVITIDVAHAHQESCLEFVQVVKKKYPDLEIIAGAVATYEGAKDLFLSGVDAVRVGIGTGSICTTRITTGSGMPQITAVMEAYRAGQEFGKPIIADGGIKNSGDIVKALAAGGNAVTAGKLLAGADECPGSVFESDGKKYKEYNGSTSRTEKVRQMEKNSSEKSPDYIDFVEGIEGCVECQGSVANLLARIDKGIRSGLSYSGAFSIEELHQKARFVQVTNSITIENNNRGIISR